LPYEGEVMSFRPTASDLEILRRQSSYFDHVVALEPSSKKRKAGEAGLDDQPTPSLREQARNAKMTSEYYLRKVKYLAANEQRLLREKKKLVEEEKERLQQAYDKLKQLEKENFLLREQRRMWHISHPEPWVQEEDAAMQEEGVEVVMRENPPMVDQAASTSHGGGFVDWQAAMTSSTIDADLASMMSADSAPQGGVELGASLTQQLSEEARANNGPGDLTSQVFGTLGLVSGVLGPSLSDDILRTQPPPVDDLQARLLEDIDNLNAALGEYDPARVAATMRQLGNSIPDEDEIDYSDSDLNDSHSPRRT
jgi:hypothetical protein